MAMTRKRFIFQTLMVLAGLLTVTPICAQTNAQKHFRLVYIDHEPKAMPEKVNELCDKLITLHNNALESGDALIIYLANGNEPVISLTNLSGFTKTRRMGDAAADFGDIIYAIQNFNMLDVNVERDSKNLADLLTSHFKICDNQQQLKFKSVIIEFYVGPQFWQLRYNESIIAKLYVSLRMRSLLEKYRSLTQLQFNVWKAKGDNLFYLIGKPFGIANPDGINDKVTITEY